MTSYYPHKVVLSDGQKASLAKAFSNKTAITLRLKYEDIAKESGVTLHLTASQIKKIKQAISDKRGVDVKMSKTQIRNTIQRRGSLFSTLFSLAKPLMLPAAKALGTAGLSFGAEKLLKKIFGKGYGPREVELYQLTQRLTPAQKRLIVGEVLRKGQSSAQYGGFLGMLAALGIPLAIDLVKKVLGKGLQVKPKGGKGMRVSPAHLMQRPPPFIGTWGEKK